MGDREGHRELIAELLSDTYGALSATMVSSSFLLVSLAVHPELGGRLPLELWPVCFVFHVKVMYAFAVDHYGGQASTHMYTQEK